MAEYHIQVLERTFQILEELADGSEEMAPIEKRVNLHRSTTHRLLAILEQNRFVERTPANARYRLGWRLFELAMIAASRLGLYERAKPWLAELVKETCKTAHIGLLRQGEVISLLNVEGERSVRTPATVGRRTPLHCASQGKTILAFAPPEQVEAALSQYRFTEYTPNTITKRERFETELKPVRRRRFAVDNGEFEKGLRGLGAPVRDHSGEAIVVSIAGPSFRIAGPHTPAPSKRVMAAAGRLAASMGYAGKTVTAAGEQQ